LRLSLAIYRYFPVFPACRVFPDAMSLADKSGRGQKSGGEGAIGRGRIRSRTAVEPVRYLS
jgi:hypothetical protein